MLSIKESMTTQPNNQESYSCIIISKWTPIEDQPQEVERSMRRVSQLNGQNNKCSTSNQQEMGIDFQFDSSDVGGTGFECMVPGDGYMQGNVLEGGQQGGFTRAANKRDEFNMKLGHRDQHTQVGQNPFLAGESYIQHLNVQENFLRPQNTNMIYPKNEE